MFRMSTTTTKRPFDPAADAACTCENCGAAVGAFVNGDDEDGYRGDWADGFVVGRIVGPAEDRIDERSYYCADCEEAADQAAAAYEAWEAVDALARSIGATGRDATQDPQVQALIEYAWSLS